MMKRRKSILKNDIFDKGESFDEWERFQDWRSRQVLQRLCVREDEKRCWKFSIWKEYSFQLDDIAGMKQFHWKTHTKRHLLHFFMLQMFLFDFNSIFNPFQPLEGVQKLIEFGGVLRERHANGKFFPGFNLWMTQLDSWNWFVNWPCLRKLV